MREDVALVAVLDLVLLDVTIVTTDTEVVLVHLEIKCKAPIFLVSLSSTFTVFFLYISRGGAGNGEQGQEEDANPGDNLFITGLSIRTSGADLEALFAKYGKVGERQRSSPPFSSSNPQKLGQ